MKGYLIIIVVICSLLLGCQGQQPTPQTADQSLIATNQALAMQLTIQAGIIGTQNAQSSQPPSNIDVPTQPPSLPQTEPTSVSMQPTSPLSSNTSPGTHLKVSETWVQDGFYLTLSDYKLDVFQGKDEIWLSFVVTNRTGSDISLSLDMMNITLETNTGQRFTPFYKSNTNQVWKKTLRNQERADVWFEQMRNYAWLGDYSSPDVTSILVTVRDWSRIKEAVWEIKINH